MADVVLAECDGQVWLVAGEEHIDALLIDKLAPGVTVELVTCDTRAAVYAMWQQMSSDPAAGAQPWTLNPLITRRILGGLGLAPGVVRFTPWSAMLDETSAQTMAGAVAWLAANPGGTVVLRQFEAAEPGPGQADLQRLRGQLALAALVRAGAEAVRLTEDRAAAEAEAQMDEMHIVLVPTP